MPAAKYFATDDKILILDTRGNPAIFMAIFDLCQRNGPKILRKLLIRFLGPENLHIDTNINMLLYLVQILQ